MIVPSYTPADVEKFWRFVDRRGDVECWPWKRATPGAGYGEFSAGGVRLKAHRACYFIVHGNIPVGMMIDHQCRNRACVNPAHLRAVTPRINSIENSSSFAAINAAKTHCPSGHPLIEGNLRKGNKTRACFACFKVKHAERKRKARQAAGSLFGEQAA